MSITDVLHRLRLVIFAIAVANFVAFVAGAIILGGDAVNGFVKDGHYFVVNKGHATEVSRAAFVYGRVHVFSLFVTHPLAILVGFLTSRGRNSGDS